MKCVKCEGKSQVLESRVDGLVGHRTRRCLSCDYRWKSEERLAGEAFPKPKAKALPKTKKIPQRYSKRRYENPRDLVGSPERDAMEAAEVLKELGLDLEDY